MKFGTKKTPEQSVPDTPRASAITREPLERILADRVMYELFREWAAENLCSENLLFYYEVEKFRALEDEESVPAEAQRIYSKFVRPKSATQVNLDYDCLSAIESALENPTIAIFDEARYAVGDLIRYDLYLKFLDSDLYKEFKGLPTSSKHHVARRRNVHIAELPHLSYNQITSLSSCLSDPSALDEFLKFTYNEFSDGVVLFYLEVDRYERKPSIEFARKIFNKFLGFESEEEVDTDPKIKNYIRQQIQLEQSPPDLFHNLKIQVFAVMVQDNFLRFQNYILTSLAVV